MRGSWQEYFMEIAESIAKRLDKSLLTYDDELSKGVEYIQSKSELTVLKKL